MASSSKDLFGWASDWMFQDKQPDEGSSERNLLITLNAKEALAAKVRRPCSESSDPHSQQPLTHLSIALSFPACWLARCEI